MKKSLLLALLAVALALPALGEDRHQSYISYDDGDTIVRSGEDGREIEAHRNLPIYPGDEIITARRGRAEIRLSDGNIIGIDRTTALRLRSVLDAYEGDSNETIVELRHGGLDDANGFNHAAKTSALWTRDHLSQTNLKFLRNLTVGPVVHRGVLLCHGSPYDEDEYVFNVHHAAQILALFSAPFILYGHTHLPVLFSIDKDLNVSGFAVQDELTVRLNPDLRYLLNPGSVGQPRDRNPKASCMILDTEKMTVQFLRVEYDIAATQAKIRKAGLPEILASRLAHGT